MSDEFDFVVVGAGTAGCVLAGRLSENPGARVCLIEAGPSDATGWVTVPAGTAGTVPAQRLNWAFETVPQEGLNGRRGYQPRGKVLGGSSSINAMCYVRGHPADYDDWARAGCAGWGWSDVLPYFLRSEGNERFANEWHGRNGPLKVSDLRSPSPFSAIFVEAARQAGYPYSEDFNGAQHEGVGRFQVTQSNGERCNAARAYLAPARARANLEILTSASAERLVFEGRRCVGVELRSAGTTRTIRARREVLVSCGALQSPPLLMASGIGPGARLQMLGIPVVAHSSQVGQNLQDHLDCTIARRHDSLELFGLGLRWLWHLRGQWRLYRSERRGQLTTNFAEAGGFIKTLPGLERPDVQLHFVIAMVDDHGRRRHYGQGYSLHACVLRPRSRGEVRLVARERVLQPEIDPRYLSEPEDLATLVRGFQAARRILGARAFAPYGGRELHTEGVRDDDVGAIERSIRAHADTIYHPVGTCRMGADADSVVDPELRVRGVEALRVVDASIMPTLIGGNTNAPTVMIAERASDLVRRRGS